MCTTVPHLLCVRQNTQKSYKVRHFITFVLWQGHNGLEPCQVGKPSYRQVSWNLCIFTSSLPCWEYSVYHCPSSMWVWGSELWPSCFWSGSYGSFQVSSFTVHLLSCPYSSKSLSTLREWILFTKARTKPDLRAFVGLGLVSLHISGCLGTHSSGQAGHELDRTLLLLSPKCLDYRPKPLGSVWFPFL